MPIGNVHIVGILNITPDSFSDAGEYSDLEHAIKLAKRLFQDGADIVDIGGDSTRPGSICVGSNEEWRRISSIVKEVSKYGVVSVDTHFAETAERALLSGAQIINDISGGADPEMFRIVASHGAKIAVMYSRCSSPHKFDLPTPNNLIDAIRSFFEDRIVMAEKAGIKREQIIFDPGMGGFLSDDPKDSLRVLDEVNQFIEFSPLLIGISRKGFLSKGVSIDLAERDRLSALVGAKTVVKYSSMKDIYLRVHNVSFQLQALQNIS